METKCRILCKWGRRVNLTQLPLSDHIVSFSSVSICTHINYALVCTDFGSHPTALSFEKRNEQNIMKNQLEGNKLRTIWKEEEFVCDSTANCGIQPYHLLSRTIILEGSREPQSWLDTQAGPVFPICPTGQLDPFFNPYLYQRTTYSARGVLWICAI